MTLPVFPDNAIRPASLDAALREWGGFFVDLTSDAPVLEDVLVASRAFFDLPRDNKAAIAIGRSDHFRGWSEMHNARDWREQIHLGREQPRIADGPAYSRLAGPNLWPADPHWRLVVSRYMDAMTTLGENLLHGVGRAIAVDESHFGNVKEDGYLVMKVIGYHPQASTDERRPGVAAHVDFSWLTINLQDSEGLEIRRPDGAWVPVAVRPGAVWIHAGELLEFATRGRYRATPHRVVNPSASRMRVSIPTFINPPLDFKIPVFSGGSVPSSPRMVPASEHVHRVLRLDLGGDSLHFGQAEWRRKGSDRWCFVCRPENASSERQQIQRDGVCETDS